MIGNFFPVTNDILIRTVVYSPSVIIALTGRTCVGERKRRPNQTLPVEATRESQGKEESSGFELG